MGMGSRKCGEATEVFNRLSKNLAGILALSVLAGVFTVGAWAQAPKAPAVKDQGEYDLTQAITKEADPQKKLDLLNQWEQKYPESDFKGQRAIMMMQTEGQIAGKGAQPGASAGDLDTSQKAAQHLIDNLDKYMADDNKPAAATADQWKDAKQQVAVQAHTALATIDMSRKTPAADGSAETEFKKILELTPNNASASYTLGTLILRLKKVERYPEALYYIARAIDDSGPLALTPAGKKAAEDYLKRAYNGYHGSNDGLDDVMKAAMASAIPPSGFTIESITDIQKKQEGDAAAFATAHPDLALWRTIKAALTAADGDAYFTQVKGSEIPPQEGDVKFKMFTGKVVAQNSPKELLVNVDSPVGDATLQFEAALKGTIEVGTEVKFKGVIDAYTKDPYMLTFTGMGKEDVDGLPAAAFAAAPARKPRPVTKKK
jgi:tetratricopeptide (TPR) repeat protein